MEITLAGQRRKTLDPREERIVTQHLSAMAQQKCEYAHTQQRLIFITAPLRTGFFSVQLSMLTM
jgi:hypothetical protein